MEYPDSPTAFRRDLAAFHASALAKRLRRRLLTVFCALWVLYQNMWEGSFVPMVYVHELGHGVAAILLLGEAKDLRVFRSGPIAGEILTRSPLPGSGIVIGAGGAVAETLVSAGLTLLPWAVCRGIGIGCLVDVGLNLVFSEGQFQSDLMAQGRLPSRLLATTFYLFCLGDLIRRLRRNWLPARMDEVLHGGARRIPERTSAVREGLRERGFYQTKIYTDSSPEQRIRQAKAIKQRSAERRESMRRMAATTRVPARPATNSRDAAEDFRRALRRQRENERT